MTTFWLATFKIDPVRDDSVVGPIAGAGTTTLAVEVLQDEGEWAVLISSANEVHPTTLKCVIGFANGAKACSIWLDRGFPLVDARIDRTATGLHVVVPLFSQEPVMHYDAGLLSLTGLADGISTSSKVAGEGAGMTPLRPCYEQEMVAPDGAQPDLLVAKGPISWNPVRSNVRPLPQDRVNGIRLALAKPPSRCPSLAPLGEQPLQAVAAWTGDIVVPAEADGQRRPLLVQQPTSHGFGVPAFRFEDVEVLGFRIDLSEYDKDFERDLARLVAPLNFHLTGSSDPGGRRRRSTPGFRYRAATSVLIIELLRYGRMKARVPTPPLSIDDSQSQHELVVRLLVGRVDDDSAQAHAPAMFVPAVFVDNPWSKVLGRDAIGYDKRMAEFLAADTSAPRLLPDGRRSGTAGSRTLEDHGPEPLGNISRINLVERTGASNGPRLVDFAYSSNDHTDPDAFGPIDLSLTLGSSVLAGTRWRQSDFDAIEFRRSFASLAVADSARAFRCIQVAPVARRGTLEPTWITGTFSVDPDMRVALPSGVATLTLHAVPKSTDGPRSASTAPPAWNLLCEMLGDGKEARLTAAGGNWYRLLCSMDLTIDDGLDWGTLGS